MSDNNPYGGGPQGPYGPGQGPGGPQQGGVPQPGPQQGGPGPQQGAPGQGWGPPAYPPQGQPGYPPQGPAQGQPGGGYAFGPFAPAGQPGQPYGPYGAPMQPGQPGGPPAGPGPKRRSKLPIILGAALLALILLGVAVVALVGRTKATVTPPYSTQQQTDPAQSPSAPAGAATKASDAVNGYLQAVAAGKTAEATAYGVSEPTDKSLLNPKIVAESRRRAPITNISVPELADPYATTVPASYRVGKTQVNESFDVLKVGDSWKLSQTAARMDLIEAKSSLPLLVNGVKINSNTAYALPGTYSFTSGHKYMNFGSKSVVTVKSPSDDPETYAIRPTISSSGRKAIVAATKKNFTSCLKKHSLSPKGCPFHLTDGGYHIKKSSVRWKRTGSDPFKKPKIYTYGAQASVTIKIKVSMKASCTGYANCTGRTSGLNTAYFNLASDSAKLRKWEV